MIDTVFLKRWAPPLLLALVALFAWQASGTSDVGAESSLPIPFEAKLETPVLSARRAPRAIQAPVADSGLQPAINRLVSGSTDATCLIVDIGDRRVHSLNPDLGLIPASNQKILTTFAALSKLGTDTTFSTQLYARGNISAGVLDGDLILVGGGDPFLVTDDFMAQYPDPDGRFHTRLEGLLDAVSAAGITEVTGTILADESLFDSERYPAGPNGWAQRLVDQRQSGPLSALAVNEGFSEWPSAYTGSFRPRVPATDPAVNTAVVLKQLLGEAGIAVLGEPRNEPRGSGGNLIGELVSPPLSELVLHVNSFSNNFGAEILGKHLGVDSTGVGSTQAGAAAIMDELEARGLDTTGTVINDGSGLAESDRLTCSLIADVLNTVGPNSILAKSLSISGVRGSLAIRHVDTGARNQVYAKTGTLNSSTALSGFVLSPVDPSVVATFAYLVNGELAGVNEEIRGLQEPFVEDLARYPTGPGVSDLSPLPTLSN